MLICTFFPLFHYTLSNTSSFVDRDMFSRFAGIGIDHGTQYRIQTMDGITGDGNTSENATFPVADGEDEGDNMFHAGRGTDSDNGHDGDNDGESDSESMSFDDNNSELDDLEVVEVVEEDESGFEF